MATATIDLTTLTNYNSLPVGVYTIKTVAKGEGINTPSNASTGAANYRKGTFTVVDNITNGSLSGTISVRYGQDTTVTLVPDTGYWIPYTSTIAGNCQSSIYDPSTGVISITGITGNITITANCIRKTLKTPSISLSGDNIIISDPDNNSQMYDLLSGNILIDSNIPKA